MTRRGRWPRGRCSTSARIAHARVAPLRNAFSYRSYEWLVDVDKLPRPGGWPSLLTGFLALRSPRRSGAFDQGQRR